MNKYLNFFIHLAICILLLVLAGFPNIVVSNLDAQKYMGLVFSLANGMLLPDLFKKYFEAFY